MLLSLFLVEVCFVGIVEREQLPADENVHFYVSLRFLMWRFYKREVNFEVV